MNYSKLFQFVLTFFIIIFILECSSQSNKPELSAEQRRDLAVQKNNAGAKLFQRYLLLNPSDSLFYQALDSINTAIKYDSSYDRAYYNKAIMLAEVDSLDDAIEVLDQLIRKDSTQIMAITQQGFFYERMGDTLKAQQKYTKALEAYERRIENNPNDVFAKTQRAFLFLFTHSKEKALEEINKVIKNYPGNQTAISTKKSIQTFDQEQFIESQ